MKSIVFLYHDLDGSVSGFMGAGALPFKHSVESFLRHISLLSESGETFSTFRVPSASCSQAARHYLTFDDGGISALNIARMLDEVGLKGNFFVPTRYIGQEGFMAEEDIRWLSEQGHGVGSHSHSHPAIFRELGFEEQLDEWVTSKGILEEIIGKPITMCSVPGGDMNLDTKRSAERAGFEALFTSEPTAEVTKFGTIHVLGRYCPKRGAPISDVRCWLLQKNVLRFRVRRAMKTFLKRLFLPAYRVYRHARG